MTRHIGIAACSAPGAALCYETICAEAPARLGPHAHPEITMHSFSFAEHVRALDAGDWEAVADLLVRSVEKLAAAGAEFVISPDNTVHEALPLAEPRSALPWLHIATVVTEAARTLGARRVAVLGTRFLMEGPVYPPKLEAAGIGWRIPDPADRDALHRIIFDELCTAHVTPESRARVVGIIDGLRRREGCDAVVLGCTELPLLVTPEVSPLPTLDSTRLLARAAIAFAADGG